MYSSKSGEVNTVEKGLPHGQVLKKFLVERYMVKTARNPPGKVNHSLKKGSPRNDRLTRALKGDNKELEFN